MDIINKDKHKVVYITYGSMSECPVFRTQILDLLEDLHDEGIDLHLFVLLSVRNFFNRRIKQDKEYLDKNYSQKYSYIYLSVHKQISVYLAAVIVFIKLAGCIARNERIVFHCRDEISTMFGTVFKRLYRNIQIVYDKRGVTSEEYVYEAKKKNMYDETDRMISFYSRLEKLSVAESSKVLCVSYEMKKYLMSKYKASDERISVVPCCASLNKFYFSRDERIFIRNAIGVENKIVFIYSGSLFGWQMFDRITEIFKIIQARMETVFLLVCTHDKTKGLLDGLPEDTYKVIHADSEEMFKYYSAADYGIILREDSIVNLVSSPVKIAEYVACQLPFIATNGIGDTQSIIGEENKSCVFVDPYDSVVEIAECILERLTNHQNEFYRLDEDLREYFNRKRYMEIYKMMYFK